MYKRIYELGNTIINSGTTSFLVDDPSFVDAKKTTIDDLKNYFFTKSTIIDSDYIVLKNDFILIVSGNTDTIINLTFPLIQNANQSGYIIKNVGYSAVKILTTELIDGYSDVIISYHNTSITLKPISDQWYIF